MTLRSSDGWPLTGPSWRVRRWPLISVPKHERQQQQPDADGGPRVLVAAQPACRSGRRSPSVVATSSASSSQTSWTSARPSSVAEERLGDEVLRQPLHQQERDPAEQRDGRQQDLVGPAAGEHLGDMGGEQRRRGRSRGRAGRPGANAPVTVAPERQAADHERERDQGEQPRLRASAAAAGSDRGSAAVAGRSARADARGAPARHRRARSSRNRTWPTWSSSPKPSGGDALDRPAVDVRAVGAAEVLEVPAPAAVRQDGVLRRRERVVDDDRVVDVATERRDGVERERPPRLPARRSATSSDDQPAQLARCPRAPRLAGRAAAPGPPGRGRGTGAPGTASRRTHRTSEEAVHQSARLVDLDHERRCRRSGAGRRTRGRPR